MCHSVISSQADEAYSYDENGNRTMAGYTTGTNNQLLSDGTYEYTYDAEGNRLTRTRLSNGYATQYVWDHRNRLMAVIEKDDQDNVLSPVEFKYDMFNRRIAKIVDSDGPGGNPAVVTIFSWENDQVALQFVDGEVAHRYLYGPVVDQILADETVTSTSTPGTLVWPLADYLGTLADLATHNSSTPITTISNHRSFDGYGNVTAQTNSAVTLIFSYRGRERDAETGLPYHRARYYDSAVGRWTSEDTGSRCHEPKAKPPRSVGRWFGRPGRGRSKNGCVARGRCPARRCPARRCAVRR
jgi:RHS repeat-associated protein